MLYIKIKLYISKVKQLLFIKKTEKMKKFETPIRTEIVDTYGFEISIIGETEKAYLIILSKSVRKGTSKFFERKEIEKWIPKSVWNNDNNFMEHSEDSSQIIFNTPYFLR